MACEYCEIKERPIGKIQGFEAFMTETKKVKDDEFGNYRLEIGINGALRRISFEVDSKDDEGLFLLTGIDINYCPMCGERLGDDHGA